MQDKYDHLKGIVTTVKQGDPVGEDITDWDRLDSMKEEELIENDPDTFEATPEMLKNAMVLRTYYESITRQYGMADKEQDPVEKDDR